MNILRAFDNSNWKSTGLFGNLNTSRFQEKKQGRDQTFGAKKSKFEPFLNGQRNPKILPIESPFVLSPAPWYFSLQTKVIFQYEIYVNFLLYLSFS